MAELSIKDFENALGELRRIVEQMETGELGLDASLQAFERGIRLTRQCQTALSQAQLRVQMLTSEDGRAVLGEFPVDAELTTTAANEAPAQDSSGDR